jgi:hypothetical protein
MEKITYYVYIHLNILEQRQENDDEEITLKRGFCMKKAKG